MEIREVIADAFVPMPHLNVAPKTPPLRAAAPAAPTAHRNDLNVRADVQNAFAQIGALQEEMHSIKSLLQTLAQRLPVQAPTLPADGGGEGREGDELPDAQGKGNSKGKDNAARDSHPARAGPY